MRVGTALLFLLATLAACAVPVPAPSLDHDGPSPEPCDAALLEGELLADDQDAFIVQHEEGFVTAVIWPEGYVVRDGETRELVDPSGDVVAREGDLVALGGGMNLDDTAFVVCGPFTVTPAR